MHELERLIAAIARPEPSLQLDERIEAVLTQEPQRSPETYWRNLAVWCATSACIGLAGFYGGRQSMRPAPASAPPALTSAPRTSTPPARPEETGPVSAKVLQVPLRDDQLAGLFLPSRVREGMLGNGPVTIEISTSP